MSIFHCLIFHGLKDSRRVLIGWCLGLLGIFYCGCSASEKIYQCGEVRLVKTIGFGGSLAYTLQFPDINLAQEQTNLFRLRSYPTNRPVRFWLELPRSDSEALQAGMVLWLNAIVRVSAQSLDGKVLSDEILPLRDMHERTTKAYIDNSPRTAEILPLEQLDKAVSGLADYDLVIRVEKSSRGTNDILLFRGEGRIGRAE